MTAVSGRAAPLRFLIGVLLCWTLGRIVMLADWSDGKAERPPSVAGEEHLPKRPSPLLSPVAMLPEARREVIASRSLTVAGAPLSVVAGTSPHRVDRGQGQGQVIPSSPPSHPRQSPEMVDASAILVPRAPGRSRWSGSAWALVRGGGRARALAPVGQIGGGQAGARLLYRLDGGGRLSAAARVSRTIGGPRQTEAAVGLDWKPVDRLPLHVMADRRIAIDRGGRNAWTLGVAGGVYAMPLTGHWRLDGYGEAGVVGAQRRDLYADGAVRVARAVELGGAISLALGGGVWGAAQPGAQRLDAGPSAVLRLPVAGRAVAVALDWRERVAGAARPGSGIALTVATDF